MRSQTFDNLADLRGRGLGFSPSFAASRLGMDVSRLEAIESGTAVPSVTESELMARLYGIDEELLEETPIVLRHGDGIQLLALRNELEPLGADTTSRIIEVANAAQELMSLESELGLPDRQLEFATRRMAPPTRRKDQAPHAVGANWARALCKSLALNGPVPSVTALVAHAWPQVRVLYADLGKNAGLSGLTFADGRRGPTIVLNLRGRNEHPLVRRFSLAHELAHLLIDFQRGQPLALLSQFGTDQSLDIEARANAFAMRLLCPEKRAREIVRRCEGDALQAARLLVIEWGVHYGAARLYLRNIAGVLALPPQPPPDFLTSFDEAVARRKWDEAEQSDLDSRFPFPSVPSERQTHLARAAVRLFAQGKMSRGRLCDTLYISRAESVERLVDYFDLHGGSPDLDDPHAR